MNNKQEWNEFLDNLLSNAIAEHNNSEECKRIKRRQEHMDEMLTTNLTEDEKTFVEEILFELGLMSEREKGVVYRQGFKDCVWLLKNLGIEAGPLSQQGLTDTENASLSRKLCQCLKEERFNPVGEADAKLEENPAPVADAARPAEHDSLRKIAKRAQRETTGAT